MERAIECPGCGLKLPERNITPHEQFNASGECWDVKGELSAYNATSGDFTFIQQYCVDAYGAQHAGNKTKAITIVYALVGLYLAVEHHFTGKQVQHAHMNIAKPETGWPHWEPPQRINEITVLDVLNCEPEKPRNDMILKWAKYVWNSWKCHHDTIREFCHQYIKDDRILALLR